jgi:predicted small lipoprotein YifL
VNTKLNLQRANWQPVIGALLLVLLLVGCGTKGPLVLPDKPAATPEAASVGWVQPTLPFTHSRWVGTHPSLLASVGWVQPTIPFTHSRWVGTHPTLRDWFEPRAQ